MNDAKNPPNEEGEVVVFSTRRGKQPDPVASEPTSETPSTEGKCGPVNGKFAELAKTQQAGCGK